MGYDRRVLFFLVAGLLVFWSKLLHVSCYNEALIPRYCLHPPHQRDCGKALLHYYYDIQRDTCQQFVYKGCETGLNNFRYPEDCITACQLFVMLAKSQDPPSTLPERCTFPKETGRCKAAHRRYYYNTEKKKCEEFIYGGCGGNPNRFGNIMDCIQECEDAVKFR